MQPSANHDFERLEDIERRLRLQNTVTQLQILIARSHTTEPSYWLARAVRAANARPELRSNRSGE